MKRHTALHVPLFLLHTKPYPCRVSNLSSFAALRSSGYNLLARLPSRVDNPPHRRPLVSTTPIRSSLRSAIPMTQRRTHSSQSETPKKKENQIAHTEDNHFHRDHSYSIFGHSHSHNGDNGHSHGTEHIVAALRGDKRDRGSYITLVGLSANIILTAVKGAAGWYLHSASLLADAGHSLSGMIDGFSN